MDIFKEKTFYVLWASSVFGALAVLPYSAAITGAFVLTPQIVFAVIAQAVPLYALILFLGMKMNERTGFKYMPYRSFIVTSIVSGLSVGAVIRLLDKFLFSTRAQVLIEQAAVKAETNNVLLWKSFLASFYGGINEEVLLRLFLLSLFVFMLQKFSRLKRISIIVVSTLLSALLFGLGHLPALYSIVSAPNSWDIIRVIVLNGFAGVLFGWLYYRYGLMASMVSHFVVDLVIHLF